MTDKHGGSADDDAAAYEIDLAGQPSPAPRRPASDAAPSEGRSARRWWLGGGVAALLLVGGVVATTLGDDGDAPMPPSSLTPPTAAPGDPSTEPGPASPPVDLEAEEASLPPGAIRNDPSAVWTLDAAALTDQVGRTPWAPDGTYEGSVDMSRPPADGTFSTGTTVVALVGAGTERAMVVGVHARTGEVRWRAPEPGAHTCQYVAGGHAVLCATGSGTADVALVLAAASGEEVGRWTTLDCLPARAAGTPSEILVAGRTVDDSPCLARGDIRADGPEVELTYSPDDGKDPLDSYRVYEPELTVRDDVVLYSAPPVVLSTTTAIAGFRGVAPNSGGYLHPEGSAVTTTPLAPNATPVGFNNTVTTLPGGAEVDGSTWARLDGTDGSTVVGVGDAAVDVTGKTLWTWDATDDPDVYLETHLGSEVAIRVAHTSTLDTWIPDLTAVAVAPESGAPLWEIELPESTLAPAVELDGVLLWADQMSIGAGHVAAQDVVTGEWLWSNELDATAEGALFRSPELQVVGDVVVRSFADHLGSLAF